MRSIIVSMMLLYFWHPLIAKAEDVHSGNFMLKVCENNNLYSTCMAFIVGVLDGVQVQKAVSQKDSLYCSPGGVTLEQIKEMLIKRLRQYPEENHLPAAQSLYVTMAIAFPCPSGAK